MPQKIWHQYPAVRLKQRNDIVVEEGPGWDSVKQKDWLSLANVRIRNSQRHGGKTIKFDQGLSFAECAVIHDRQNPFGSRPTFVDQN